MFLDLKNIKAIGITQVASGAWGFFLKSGGPQERPKPPPSKKIQSKALKAAKTSTG